jgi:endoglucanase
VDPVNPIYLGGNEWSAAMSLATKNPDWPLTGTNLIYEVHMYLCAGSSGQRYDFDAEVAERYSAGFGEGSITLNTGVERLKLAVDWAKPRGIKLALTETGMPIDDPRWQEMFTRLMNFARANDVDVYHWSGGNQWSVRNAGINFVPGWHQNRTLEPSSSGVMKAAVGISKADLFDDGPGWAPAGSSVTITVYARGALSSPVTITVASSNGGTLSKSTLTIPAGANGQDQFTFTPPPNAVATLTYASSSPAVPPPPPRRVYSLADPVAYASTNLKDAAMALIAKYSACKWELADGYTDYMQGAPAAAGQKVRAISDSGYGSSPGNAMEMLNWLNDSPNMGTMTQPVMRVTNGRKHSDHSAANTWGFWCKKTIPLAVTQPNPRNRTPYSVQEPHFTIAAVSVPGAISGIVFQASFSGHMYASELRFSNGRPQARLVDQQANTVLLTSPTALAANQPAVVSLTSVPGAQRLRVNSTVVGSEARTLPAASPCDQLLIGMGFTEYFPRESFNGNIYSVITGKGTPTAQELAVMERYLASTAGI